MNRRNILLAKISQTTVRYDVFVVVVQVLHVLAMIYLFVPPSSYSLHLPFLAGPITSGNLRSRCPLPAGLTGRGRPRCKRPPSPPHRPDRRWGWASHLPGGPPEECMGPSFPLLNRSKCPLLLGLIGRGGPQCRHPPSPPHRLDRQWEWARRLPGGPQEECMGPSFPLLNRSKCPLLAGLIGRGDPQCRHLPSPPHRLDRWWGWASHPPGGPLEECMGPSSPLLNLSAR